MDSVVLCPLRASPLHSSFQLCDKEETLCCFLGLRAHLPDFMASKEQDTKSVLSDSDEVSSHESQGEWTWRDCVYENFSVKYQRELETNLPSLRSVLREE